ncbi:penicillin-binding protein 2 [Microgenomates group bacterium]|nr:penicillin-binding protein 2 [Microgenomates group bacterium]
MMDPDNTFWRQFRRRRLYICLVFSLLCLLIIGRFFSYQIVRHHYFTALADNQYYRTYSISGQRGRIFTTDGALLVGNQDNYRLFLDNHLFKILTSQTSLTDAYHQLSLQLAPILFQKYPEETPSSIQNIIFNSLLERQDNSQITLDQLLSADLADQVRALQQRSLGLDPVPIRIYPEASMAAQIIGYVGKTDAGVDIGYSGIEGALDKDLAAQVGRKLVLVAADGQPIADQIGFSDAAADGRDIYLTIRRDLQFFLEDTLVRGLETTGAESGEIIVMDPKTGFILGWATYPSYYPADFRHTDPTLFHNPSLSQQYEPGSVFKMLTVAAGIDSLAVAPSTPCTKCAGPRAVYDATIKNWDNKYYPNITVAEGLARSDNTAMVFIAEALGQKRFQDYIDRFLLNQPLSLEMQEDKPAFQKLIWGPVELATRSFGQGITMNSLQLLRAASALANQGAIVQPQIISKIVDNQTLEEFITQPEVVAQAISEQAAQTMIELLISSAQHTNTHSIFKDSRYIAGKTGTAQIPNPSGRGYLDNDQTVHTFVGFAPAHDPAFIMLVKFTRPSSSPWAEGTVVPVWNKVAQRLSFLLDIDLGLEE